MPQPYRHGELVIVIDCADLDRSARFWTEVLGYAPGRVSAGPYRQLLPPGGAGIEVACPATLPAAAARKPGKMPI